MLDLLRDDRDLRLRGLQPQGDLLEVPDEAEDEDGQERVLFLQSQDREDLPN